MSVHLVRNLGGLKYQLTRMIPIWFWEKLAVLKNLSWQRDTIFKTSTVPAKPRCMWQVATLSWVMRLLRNEDEWVIHFGLKYLDGSDVWLFVETPKKHIYVKKKCRTLFYIYRKSLWIINIFLVGGLR